MGRTANLPRIRPEVYALLPGLPGAGVADKIERALLLAAAAAAEKKATD